MTPRELRTLSALAVFLCAALPAAAGAVAAHTMARAISAASPPGKKSAMQVTISCGDAAANQRSVRAKPRTMASIAARLVEMTSVRA